MNSMIKLCAAVATLLAAGTANLHAAVLHTFDTAGDLDLYFNAASQNLTMYSEDAGEGLGGTIGVAASRALGGTGARIEKAGFAGNLSSYTISYYFRYLTPDRTDGTFTWALGVAPSNDYLVSIANTGNPEHNHLFFGVNYAGLVGGIHTFGLRISNMVAGTISGASSGQTFTFDSGAWYHVAGDVSVNAGNQYDITTRLYEADANGTLGTLLDTYTRTNLTNTVLLNDPTVHAFFASGSASARRGADVIDNFLSPVPEPATGLLLVFAGSALALARRRRR